jgi:hypothetical protein
LYTLPLLIFTGEMWPYAPLAVLWLWCKSSFALARWSVIQSYRLLGLLCSKRNSKKNPAGNISTKSRMDCMHLTLISNLVFVSSIPALYPIFRSVLIRFPFRKSLRERTALIWTAYRGDELTALVTSGMRYLSSKLSTACPSYNSPFTPFDQQLFTTIVT